MVPSMRRANSSAPGAGYSKVMAVSIYGAYTAAQAAASETLAGLSVCSSISLLSVDTTYLNLNAAYVKCAELNFTRNVTICIICKGRDAQ